MLQLHVDGRDTVIDWQRLHADTAHSAALQRWIQEHQSGGHCELDAKRFGDLPRWLAALQALPALDNRDTQLDHPAPRVQAPIDDTAVSAIRTHLMALHPWRKGPFEINGIHVDAEWRSDQKWERIQPALAPLGGRRVLDVGCGNGYFCFRLVGAGATLALGIDPSPLFNVQFAALKHLFGHCPAHLLPLPDTALISCPAAFDTALSMGVLYHRKSPFEHLALLYNSLRPGGELLLETLVVEGDINTVLVPGERYARMRNVWFLPSIGAMAHWLSRAGFCNVRCVSDTETSVSEQRSTDWMRFESHDHALDPIDPRRTVEGLPAPRRAAFVANRPG